MSKTGTLHWINMRQNISKIPKFDVVIYLFQIFHKINVKCLKNKMKHKYI